MRRYVYYQVKLLKENLTQGKSLTTGCRTGGGYHISELQILVLKFITSHLFFRTSLNLCLLHQVTTQDGDSLQILVIQAGFWNVCETIL